MRHPEDHNDSNARADEAPASPPPAETEAESAEPSDSDTPSTTSTEYATKRTFADFPLSPELVKGIEEHGYRFSTRVQAESIEPGLAGRHLVVRAKTGTGKTAAFGIILLERIEEGKGRPQAIVLTPTRELALQVTAELTAIAKYKDLTICTLYGGVPIRPQTRALETGVDFVVGTPGRVLDHIRRGNLDLSQCHAGCLDEADEMLSMGFLEEVSAILDNLPEKPQLLLYSATVDPRLTMLIRRYMRDPEEIILSTDTDRIEGMKHVLYETSVDEHRVRSLLAVIDQEEPDNALIFCNTREDTAMVSNFLDRQGLDAESISGDLPQSRREAVMNRVKSGEIQFLVATDVAARGIDIQKLSHVINYALPEDPSVYLHRSGRTGRIGRKGVTISLCGGPDLNTRSALENEYDITFEVRELPPPQEAASNRLDRQARALREAMQTTAFEGYLPLVRALREREGGDLLLAVALRGFFMWDRQRRSRKAEGANEGDSRKGGSGKEDDSRKTSSKRGGRRGRRRRPKRR